MYEPGTCRRTEIVDNLPSNLIHSFLFLTGHRESLPAISSLCSNFKKLLYTELYSSPRFDLHCTDNIKQEFAEIIINNVQFSHNRDIL